MVCSMVAPSCSAFVTPTTTSGTVTLPTGSDLPPGTYVLTAYNFNSLSAVPKCGVLATEPLASTFVIGTAEVDGMPGNMTGATVLSDGTSSTFDADFSTSGNIFALSDNCPDDSAYMISWGTTGAAATGVEVEFEFGGVTALTPLGSTCNAVATYTRQP
jgi:hypothetical protein